MPPSRSPSQAEVINRAIVRGQRELHVSFPVQVLAYRADQQEVDVQPLVADAYEDADGVLQIETLPVIHALRVEFPAGGSMRLTFPIQPGDPGMAVVCDRSIDAWALYGGSQQPKDLRRHHIADSWFVPGVRPRGAWKSADASVITIGDDGLASDFVATAQRCLTEIQKLKTAFDGHTHGVGGYTCPNSGTGPIALTAGTVSAAGPTSAALDAPASATVKVLG
ncbi:MAG: hypothetical protein KGL53_00155 [Elusimicrobia bacterium]|nr:hypothetical protein [Elusimicrobiota bacterium]